MENIINKNDNMKAEKIKSRKIYLDILRILACYLVLICHTIEFTYKSNVIEENWIFSNALYYISKIAVPIFFMLSGSLILRKDIGYKQILNKIVCRLLIPLFVVSFLAYFKLNPIFTFENLLNFFRAFCNADVLLSYWFIYSLIGMYICTPFLRKMVKNMDKKDFLIFFSIFIIVTGILPIFSYYTNVKITEYFVVPIIGRWIPYYLLGYFMFEKNEIKSTNKGAIIATAIGIISLIISVVLTYLDVKYKQTPTMFLDKVDYINLFALTVSIAYLIKYFFENKVFSGTISKIIINISECTFGMYLIHHILIGRYEYIYKFLENYIGSTLGIILHNVVFFSILFIIICIIRKLPYAKKFI